MLFFSLFKTLIDQEVTVELKNNLKLTGTLKSVDQYLNLKLDNISTPDSFLDDNGDMEYTNNPHFAGLKNLFIRGSNIRYVHLKKSFVDCNLLQDAARRELTMEKREG